MNLTGKRGKQEENAPHITEQCVFAENPERLIAMYSCTYCEKPLPEAGLGLAFWTRGALLRHLAGCTKAPKEVMAEAKGCVDKDDLIRADIEEKRNYGGRNPVLVSTDPQAASHFLDKVILDPEDTTRIVACYACKHCRKPIRDAGYGGVPWTNHALWRHLAQCPKAAKASRMRAKASLPVPLNPSPVSGIGRPIPVPSLVHMARLQRGIALLGPFRPTDFDYRVTAGAFVQQPTAGAGVHLFVDVSEEVSDETRTILIALKWVPEDDGYVWRFTL